MKLKLIAASMSLLGLISSTAFAADDTTTVTTKKTTHHKRYHHRMVRCHRVAPCARVAPCDFKNEGALPCELRQPCVTECGMPTSWYQPYLDSMGQNMGRAKPT